MRVLAKQMSLSDLEENRKLIFRWGASSVVTTVDVTFEPETDRATKVTVRPTASSSMDRWAIRLMSPAGFKMRPSRQK